MSGKFRLRAVVGGLTFNQTSKATLVQKTQSQIPITIRNPLSVPMVADVFLSANAPQGLVMMSSQRVVVKPLESVQIPIPITVTTEAQPTAVVQIPLTITTGMASENGVPVGGTREDVVVTSGSINPAPWSAAISGPGTFSAKQGDTVSVPVELTFPGSGTNVVFTLDAPDFTNVTIVNGSDSVSVGTGSTTLAQVQLKIGDAQAVTPVPLGCVLTITAYLGLSPAQKQQFLLKVDKTTAIWTATEIKLNGAVHVEQTTLTMSSDGTWQWNYQIRDDSILRGDTYVFTFTIGNVGFFHEESLGTKETDVRNFASAPPDAIVQQNWRAFFAKGPLFEGDASDKWSIPTGAQWLKDHWGDIANTLDGTQI